MPPLSRGGDVMPAKAGTSSVGPAIVSKDKTRIVLAWPSLTGVLIGGNSWLCLCVIRRQNVKTNVSNDERTRGKLASRVY